MRRNNNDPWCPHNPARLDASANQWGLQRRTKSGPPARPARPLTRADVNGTSTWLASGDGGQIPGHRVWIGDIDQYAQASDVRCWCVDGPLLGQQFMEQHCLDLSVSVTSQSGAAQVFTAWRDADSANRFYEVVYRWFFAVPESMGQRGWRWVSLRCLDSSRSRQR